MKPTKSVEEIIQAIEKFQLLSSKDLAAMRSRWLRADRKDAADPEAFRKWLVMNRYVTEFVAKVLSGRKSDQLVLNQYRLLDQFISGPMAGAYLAMDPLERRVAIEVLSASSAADPAVLHGFQEAAAKAQHVQHPNVGRILDSGAAHGFHYLVKEYYEGQSLEDVLERRSKLPYEQATRLMALALAGVEALHAAGVSAGDLAADCLLLTPSPKDPKQRTIKILHAGVRRRLFDETAIGRSISIAQGIPDELELAKSYTFHVDRSGAVNPPDDIFRLGCLFYRCITGRTPYSAQELARLTQPATPVCQAAPEVPEMLGQIIDGMIDPNPANRPQKAAHVAKSLRVFLAAEEQSHDVKAEENIAHPAERTPAYELHEEPMDEHEETDDAEPEEMDAPPQRPARRRPAEPAGAMGKAAALWHEIRPQTRDAVFLASGALGILVLVFMLQLLTGLGFVYLVGLATGAAVSYFVEAFVRWRQGRGTESS